MAWYCAFSRYLDFLRCFLQTKPNCGKMKYFINYGFELFRKFKIIVVASSNGQRYLLCIYELFLSSYIVFLCSSLQILK